jgi:alkylation response protein AidB-like acyl-CoA dehydrogenase
MELGISDDQQLMVDTTRRFLDSEVPLTEVRGLHEQGGGFDRSCWRRGAELGWTSFLVGENLGGGSISGAGLMDLVLVAEEFGRSVSPGPLLPVNVVCSAISRAGATGQQREILTGMMSGDHIGTWALAEPGRRWDDVRISAKSSGGAGVDLVLDGTKTLVQEAQDADWFLVTARTDDGLTQLLVPKEAEGLSVSPLRSLDMVRRFASVTFDNVSVPAWAIVGVPGDAEQEVRHQVNVALALQNAETVGAIDRVYEFTVEYCKARFSFGRPVASYQAIKHRLADLKLWLESCHATAVDSALAVAGEAPDAFELVSVAKSYISDRAPALVQDCVQMHGGIGVTWEADLHLYLRRVAQNAALYGSAQEHRERIAVLLGM